MTTLADWLHDLPLIAILRGIRPDEAVAIGETLFAEGFGVIEVPLNSPDPFASIRALAAALGGRALVGAGTVLSAEDARRTADAGGRLVVAPNGDAAVVRAAKDAGLFALPGVATPSEAFAMLAAGADALKLFPAEGLPPAVVKAMLAVLPRGTALMPVGGETMAPYWQAGARGFGLGSALYKPGDGPAAVAAKARAFRDAFAAMTGDA